MPTADLATPAQNLLHWWQGSYCGFTSLSGCLQLWKTWKTQGIC